MNHEEHERHEAKTISIHADNAVILMGASGDLKDLASNVRALSNRVGPDATARSFGVPQDDNASLISTSLRHRFSARTIRFIASPWIASCLSWL